MRKIILLILIIVSIFLLGGCAKYTKHKKPYTQKDILRFAEDSYHDDFEIIEVEVYSETPANIIYTLSPSNNPDFTFIISSSIGQVLSIDGQQFGPYEKQIYSSYIGAVADYHRKEIEKLAHETEGRISIIFNDFTGLVNEFSDLEIVADFIAKADKQYNFSFDLTISNPISNNFPDFLLPHITILKTPSNPDDNRIEIVTINYSLYGEELDYDEILKELQRNYIEKVKRGEFTDSTIPIEMYDEFP